jgi:putative membrane protein
MPHPEFLEYLPAGTTLYGWSMAGGGVMYILLGTTAVALYAYRTLGLKALLSFLVPAIAVSLTSELTGTSTGFPFGDYSYLNGLGYKIGGLVPFTIPLSWFYLGISSYLLARGGLAGQRSTWWRHVAAIAVGALLLMSWDFVLDPAMSQTAMPFWYWHQPGAFFGMPYQNFAGWFLTGMLFMSIAAIFWSRNHRLKTVAKEQLTLPIAVYLANFTFAMLMSLASGIVTPVLLGLAVGAAPAIACWLMAPSAAALIPDAVEPHQPPDLSVVEMATPAGISK